MNFKKSTNVFVGSFLVAGLFIFGVLEVQATCNCSSLPSAVFEITDEPGDVEICGDDATMTVKLHASCDECLINAKTRIVNSAGGSLNTLYVDHTSNWPLEIETYWSGGRNHGIRLYSFTQDINGPTTMWANAYFIRNGCHCCADPGNDSDCPSWVVNSSDHTNGATCYINADIGTVSKEIDCNQRLTAAIDAPVADATFSQGSSINFIGHGDNPSGSIVAYQWCDGDCTGAGTTIGNASTFNIASLSLGAHTIYFRVQGDDLGWSLQDTITITVTSTDASTIDLKIDNGGGSSDGPISADLGSNLNLIWNATDVNLNSCISSGTSWVQSGLAATGSDNITTPNSTEALAYSISCTSTSGNIISDSVVVNVACTPWEDSWSKCSTPCGGGTKTKIEMHADCSTTTQVEKCNTKPCSCR